MNPKQDEPKYVHTKTHYNQILESQDREFWKQQEKKYLSHTKELPQT